MRTYSSENSIYPFSQVDWLSGYRIVGRKQLLIFPQNFNDMNLLTFGFICCLEKSNAILIPVVLCMTCLYPFRKVFRMFTFGDLTFLADMPRYESSWIPFAGHLLNPLNMENQVHHLRKTFLHYLVISSSLLFPAFFFQLFKIPIRPPVLIPFWKKSSQPFDNLFYVLGDLCYNILIS